MGMNHTGHGCLMQVLAQMWCRAMLCLRSDLDAEMLHYSARPIVNCDSHKLSNKSTTYTYKTIKFIAKLVSHCGSHLMKLFGFLHLNDAQPLQDSSFN